MGSCGTKQGKPEQTDANTLRILCLGIGGCGKSTFIKQMKLIHSEAWDEVELQNYSKIIRANIVYGLQEAVELAKKDNTDLSDIKDEVATVLDIRPRNVELSEVEVQNVLVKVYKHEKIQSLLSDKENNNEVSVDAAHLRYYYENFERIASEEFVPTDKDILYCRQRTAGVSTTAVYANKKYFEFTDVGGQKPEQKKWIQIISEHRFSAILFFTAVNEFDLISTEDAERPKLATSKKIFAEVCNSEHIGDSPVVLVFNKLDLFHAKMESKKGWKSFKSTFPDFTGDKSEISALEFIASTFTKVLDPSYSKKDSGKVVTVHHTCALDTEGLKVVWETIREGLMRASLAKAGFV